MMAAIWLRTVRAISSAKLFIFLSLAVLLSALAMAAAVMAGCLVATVKCSNWISTKLRA